MAMDFKVVHACLAYHSPNHLSSPHPQSLHGDRSLPVLLVVHIPLNHVPSLQFSSPLLLLLLFLLM
jgi:hypothetical protein